MSESEQPIPLQQIAETVSAPPAPVTGVPTQAATAKAPCGCGCMPMKIPFTTPVQKRATPEFKTKIADEAKALLNKATEVKATTRTLYSPRQPLLESCADFRATFTVPPPGRQINSPSDYDPNAQLGRLQALMQTLQSPANFQSGSYPKAVQWTSTTITTMVVDYTQVTGDKQFYPNIVQFYKNQPVFNLLTQMYDDKQWVVLTWLRAAAYSKSSTPVDTAMFLSRAKFFYDILVQNGWNTSTCGGGMKWGPFNGYKNAVTTELFVASSIGMYAAFGTQSYLDNAVKAWSWFKSSGLINPQGTVNDGLTDTCQNNGQTTWTYNQGIVLSGLSKLYTYTGDDSLIAAAQHLIDSVIASPLVPSIDGVLVESCDQGGTCNQDQWMFKGVFFEHLGYFLSDIGNLQSVPIATRLALVQKYAGFVHANAEAAWNSRGPDGMVSSWWDAPTGRQRQVAVETQGSAVAALTCAVRVDKLLHTLSPSGTIAVHHPAS